MYIKYLLLVFTCFVYFLFSDELSDYDKNDYQDQNFLKISLTNKSLKKDDFVRINNIIQKSKNRTNNYGQKYGRIELELSVIKILYIFNQKNLYNDYTAYLKKKWHSKSYIYLTIKRLDKIIEKYSKKESFLINFYENNSSIFNDSIGKGFVISKKNNGWKPPYISKYTISDFFLNLAALDIYRSSSSKNGYDKAKSKILEYSYLGRRFSSGSHDNGILNSLKK